MEIAKVFKTGRIREFGKKEKNYVLYAGHQYLCLYDEEKTQKRIKTIQRGIRWWSMYLFDHFSRVGIWDET